MNVSQTKTRRVTTIAIIALVVTLGATALAETAARSLNITEIATASQLEGGVPTSTVDSFQRNRGWIYCFMRLENPTRQEGSVYVAFEPATSGEPSSR